MLEFFWVALTSILFVVDPIGVVPLYLMMTRADPPEKRRQMVRRASLWNTVTLMVFATGGGAVLRVFAVGLPALRGEKGGGRKR